MSLSMTSVQSLYMGVIDGVISGAREFFLDEGVDEQVLTELRHIWETRLKATKAIETKPDKPPQPPVINKPTTASKPSIPLSQYVMPSGAVPAPEIPAAKMVSIQITLPSPPQPGTTTPPPPKYITIQVPASAMEGNQLQSLLTGPVISASMALSSTELATSLLQQHVNSHFAQQQQQLQQQNAGVIQQPQMSENVDQAQSFLSQAQGGVRQVDGTKDTSDDDDDEENEEEDEAEEDDDDDLDDKDEEENDENDMGAEEEPLNSGDDVSEEDTLDMFETDNVVVCQYDKITRTRNKWKFYLKDGIMNLGGKDYVFQKSNGDAEW